MNHPTCTFFSNCRAIFTLQSVSCMCNLLHTIIYNMILLCSIIFVRLFFIIILSIDNMKLKKKKQNIRVSLFSTEFIYENDIILKYVVVPTTKLTVLIFKWKNLNIFQLI